MEILGSILAILAAAIGFIVNWIYRDWKKQEEEKKRKEKEEEEAAEASKRDQEDQARISESVDEQRRRYEEWKKG